MDMTTSNNISRKDGYNNTSGYKNILPGMDSSFSGTPQPGPSDGQYTAGSLTPLDVKILRFQVLGSEDKGSDQFSLSHEGLSLKGVWNFSQNDVGRLDLGARTSYYLATPWLSLFGVATLGSDLQFSAGVNTIGSRDESKWTADFELNSANIYANDLLGIFNISYQLYYNKCFDLGTPGGAQLFNDIYYLDRDPQENISHRINLDLKPITDTAGDTWTIEGFVKWMKDRSAIVGLGVFGERFALQTYASNLSSGQPELGAQGGFSVPLSQDRKAWLDVTIGANGLINEYNRSYFGGVGLRFPWTYYSSDEVVKDAEGKEVMENGKVKTEHHEYSIDVKMNVSIYSLNTHPSQPEQKTVLWTSGSHLLSSLFDFSGAGGPSPITNTWEVNSSSFKLSSGETLTYTVSTQNASGIEGVLVTEKGTGRIIPKTDMDVQMELVKVDVYATSDAASNIPVATRTFPKGTTLKDLNDPNTGSKITFKFNDPKCKGYASFKFVISARAKVNDLGGLSLEDVELSSNVVGQLTRQ